MIVTVTPSNERFGMWEVEVFGGLYAQTGERRIVVVKDANDQGEWDYPWLQDIALAVDVITGTWFSDVQGLTEEDIPPEFDGDFDTYGGHIWSSDDIPDNPNEDGYCDRDFI